MSHAKRIPRIRAWIRKENQNHMNRLNQRILQHCNARVAEIKNLLEISSKAADIASLQGELRGLRFFLDTYDEKMQLFEKVYPMNLINNTEYPVVVQELSKDELDLFDELVQEMEEDPYWKEIRRIIQSHIQSKKEYLFNDAKQSRDLHLIHGMRDGLLAFESVTDSILDELTDIKAKYPLLNQDDDETEGSDDNSLQDIYEDNEPEDVEISIVAEDDEDSQDDDDGFFFDSVSERDEDEAEETEELLNDFEDDFYEEDDLPEAITE